MFHEIGIKEEEQKEIEESLKNSSNLRLEDLENFMMKKEEEEKIIINHKTREVKSKFYLFKSKFCFLVDEIERLELEIKFLNDCLKINKFPSPLNSTSMEVLIENLHFKNLQLNLDKEYFKLKDLQLKKSDLKLKFVRELIEFSSDIEKNSVFISKNSNKLYHRFEKIIEGIENIEERYNLQGFWWKAKTFEDLLKISKGDFELTPRNMRRR